jgi:hypothetical protein
MAGVYVIWIVGFLDNNKALYEDIQDLIINTGPITKLERLLPFALTIVILNLNKPLKL